MIMFFVVGPSWSCQSGYVSAVLPAELQQAVAVCLHVLNNTAKCLTAHTVAYVVLSFRLAPLFPFILYVCSPAATVS